jgi:large subunit ribosomal protein L13
VDTLSFKTPSATPATIKRAWFVVDAENQVVGRLASRIAHILRGKNKPYFTPHADCGDYVIVLNADKVRFTGNKLTQKEYVRYTGYPGGQRFATPKELLVRKPEAILEHAVRKMLPKNKLAAVQLKKMFVYAGTEHPHAAQKPQSLNLLNN